VPRPRKQIDAKQVEILASFGFNLSEIGLVVGCSHDTLQRRFALPIKKGQVELRFSLRQAQYKSAIQNLNVTMLIWLGKQYLGQRNEPSSTSQDDQLSEIIKNQERQYALDLARLGKKRRNNSDSGDDT
jgi:hypothetical protein